MRSTRVFAFSLMGAVVLDLCTTPARAELLAVEGERMMAVDVRTAQATVIARMQGFFMGGLALHPSGALYTAALNMLTDARYLSTIDLATATPTWGPELASYPPYDLAFSPEGTLFALRGIPTALCTIDRDTGAIAIAGSTGLLGVRSLAFAPGGTLYGWDTGDSSAHGGLGLVTIDPLTGAATDVDPSVNAPDGQPSPIEKLAFAPDGTLYGAYKDLYRVDVSTGALILIGPIKDPNSGVPHYGVGGMVWIPEPSTLTALATLAAALLLVLLRRNRKR